MHTLLRPGILVLLTLAAGLLWPAPEPVEAAGMMSISAARFHVCAVTTAGAVKCWGTNSRFQLGAPTTETCHEGPCSTSLLPVSDLQTGVVAVAAGRKHTCALTVGGGVKCWGQNYLGQLGSSTDTCEFPDSADDIPCSKTPVEVVGLDAGVKELAAGMYHTCALTTVGGIKCWGWNFFSQLGDGTINPHNLPRPTPVDVVDESGEALSGVQGIAAGYGHTCALLDGGRVACWGLNIIGDTNWSYCGGSNPRRCSTVPVDVLDEDGSPATGFVSVVAGGSKTCGITESGAAKCWGLGFGASPVEILDAQGESFSNAVAIAAARHEQFVGHICVLTTSSLQCFGLNTEGQLGDGQACGVTCSTVEVVGFTSNATAIVTGVRYSCALTTSGGVKCWGWNHKGQLGDGAGGGFDDISTTPVDVLGLESVSGDVDCSKAVTIADAQLIAQLIVGRISGLPCANNGDVDESGGVTIADAQLIAQLIVGRISTLVPS